MPISEKARLRVRRVVYATGVATALLTVIAPDVLAQQSQTPITHDASADISQASVVTIKDQFASQAPEAQEQQQVQEDIPCVGVDLVDIQTQRVGYVVVHSSAMGNVDGSVSDHAQSLHQLKDQFQKESKKFAVFALTDQAEQALIKFYYSGRDAQGNAIPNPIRVAQLDKSLDAFMDEFFAEVQRDPAGYFNVTKDQFLGVVRDTVVSDANSPVNGAISLENYSKQDVERLLAARGVSLTGEESKALGSFVTLTHYMERMRAHILDGKNEAEAKGKVDEHCNVSELMDAVGVLEDLLAQGKVRVFVSKNVTDLATAGFETYSYLFDFNGQRLVMHLPDSRVIDLDPARMQPTAYYSRYGEMENFIKNGRELNPAKDGAAYDAAQKRVKNYAGTEDKNGQTKNPCGNTNPLTRPIPMPIDNRSEEQKRVDAQNMQNGLLVAGALVLLGVGAKAKGLI